MTALSLLIQRGLFPIFIAASLTACSPGYVIRAAYEESKILLNREEIDDALEDPAVSDEFKEKLRYVKEARLFAQSLSLEPGETFTKYSFVEGDVLSWVVMGSETDSFTLKGWWFPIVGTVPYKGFFDKEDAIAAAKDLADDGLETWVRGADAFSTLGWFNDPVLSTTLKRPVPDVVETVLHETLHTTLWFPGHVDFNESFANYVGMRGAVLFFTEKVSQCTDSGCRAKMQELLEIATADLNRTLEISNRIESLYADLDTLYRSEKTKDEKLTERVEIFKAHTAPLRERYPTMKALQFINNAEIMQLKLYVTKLALFDTIYKSLGADFKKFIEEMKLVKEQYTEDDSPSLFDYTQRRWDRKTEGKE